MIMIKLDPRITRLIERGVKIPAPYSVFIAEDVDVEKISTRGVVINPGCVLKGERLFIGDGVKIGSDGPVTLENVSASKNVVFASGYAKDSVFLSDSSAGANFHIREGCLLEESASIAHSVGLKQAILFPFATLGSLINFCDCFLSGGTDKKNHSEVGSSYIHFNYTPNQDKATPSIMGNVPQGVMLDMPPVFLGGQGGMVGPCRIAFGTVIAAGSICRKDVLQAGRMVSEVHGRSVNVKRKAGFYSQIKRTVFNNVFYIANLIALFTWYKNVRSLFVSDSYSDEVHAAALKVIESAIVERKKRFMEFCKKMPDSMDVYLSSTGDGASVDLLNQKKELFQAKDDIGEIINSYSVRDFFCPDSDLVLNELSSNRSDKGKIYIDAIKSLDPEIKLAGSAWLWNCVTEVCSAVSAIIPEIGIDINKIGEL